jgi:hypothetical protein
MKKHNEVGLRPEAISEKVKNKSLRSKESEFRILDAMNKTA